MCRRCTQVRRTGFRDMRSFDRWYNSVCTNRQRVCMAAFQQRGSTVRAIVRKRGEYFTRTFKTRAEAEDWARAQELDIERRQTALGVPGPALVRRWALLDGAPTLVDILGAGSPCCRSGVYFLIHGAAVVYVGQSANVFKRLGDHITANGYGRDFDRFAVLPCAREARVSLEQHYISTLKPVFNVAGLFLQLPY